MGFAGTFDFLYSPLDKGTMSNVGYAFVNFKSHEYASKCIEAFHNYRFKRGLETFQLLEILDSGSNSSTCGNSPSVWVTTDGFSARSAAFVIFVIKASGHRKTSGKVAAVSAAHLQGLEAGGHSRFSNLRPYFS